MKGTSKKWDPRLGTFGGIRDPRPRTQFTGETRHERNNTLKVGLEIRDPGPNSQVGLKTQGLGP